MFFMQRHLHTEMHMVSLFLLPKYFIFYCFIFDEIFLPDNSIIVKVEGDEEEAKRANNQDGLQESDSDAETVSENVTEETPVHKKRHHRLSREARQEEKRTKLLQRHPLNVKIIIKLKS